tara:strand:- start:2641 stop:3150 length:510 start_codon:yes stop_codon:yes gene_type:complete
MEMLISADWLRRKIKADPDIDVEAGPSLSALEEAGMFISPEFSKEGENTSEHLTSAFGVLIRQLRRQKKWSVEELAQKARVDPEDLRKIEMASNYRPRPRVVHQLSGVFNVPERSLMKLSGATVTHDHAFEEEAMRFAAKSDDLAKLNREEQQLLNDYVKYLIEQSEKT